MNKKILVGIIAIIAVIMITVITICVISLNKSKVSPEEIWKQYISNLNEEKYDENYNMLTAESKERITRENFIERHENIYQGIEMSNMQVEITNVEEKEDTCKITYNLAMDTKAGTVSFTKTVSLSKDKDKEKGYLINWGSNLIFPSLDETDKVRVKTTTAKRGEIFDKNGVMLAGEGKVSSIGIVPGKLGENKEESIEQIANLLGISVDTINKELSASWVKDDSFVPIKKVSTNETELKSQLLQIAGVKISSVSARTYPLGEAAAHLVGYVQNITAEELETNEGKGYTANSVIGKTGLEKQYEERLKGEDGVEIYIEDADGNKKAEIIKKEAKNGEKITLTIDSNIQTKLYNESKDEEGFFVVMEPKTGAMLALVSTPSYDPNKFVLGMTNDEWNAIKENEEKPMTARYLQTWCPGSTFKPVTGAIGLTTNSLSTEDTFTYEGLSWQKDSSWGDYEVTTLTAYNEAKNLRNAIIRSDNIYFAQATLKIGKSNFINELKKLKFGESIDFVLSTSKSQYSNTDDIATETLLADSGYGQGQILVNPIHMASIYSAFVNDGNMVKPYLEETENKQVEYLVEGAFTKEAADTIKDDMVQVIENNGGTAKAMRVQGRTIAGKTGTAELKSSKGEVAETLAWFNCVTADEDSNQLLVIGMAEDGRNAGGSQAVIKKIKTLFE